MTLDSKMFHNLWVAMPQAQPFIIIFILACAHSNRTEKRQKSNTHSTHTHTHAYIVPLKRDCSTQINYIKTLELKTLYTVIDLSSETTAQSYYSSMNIAAKTVYQLCKNNVDAD